MIRDDKYNQMTHRHINIAVQKMVTLHLTGRRGGSIFVLDSET
jgi:hypothetical protein